MDVIFRISGPWGERWSRGYGIATLLDAEEEAEIEESTLLQRYPLLGIKAWCSFCNSSVFLTLSTILKAFDGLEMLNGLDILGGLDVLDGFDVFNTLDSLEMLNDIEVLNGLEVLDNLELLTFKVYDQLLLNGLADPLGIELLEL